MQNSMFLHKIHETGKFMSRMSRNLKFWRFLHKIHEIEIFGVYCTNVTKFEIIHNFFRKSHKITNLLVFMDFGTK